MKLETIFKLFTMSFLIYTIDFEFLILHSKNWFLGKIFLIQLSIIQVRIFPALGSVCSSLASLSSCFSSLWSSPFKIFVWTCTVPQTSFGNQLFIFTSSLCTSLSFVSESTLSDGIITISTISTGYFLHHFILQQDSNQKPLSL